jgi:hypothetical protein
MLNLVKSIFQSLLRSDRRRGWRVGHQGRDSTFYDEWIDGGWERIVIDGEMQFSSDDPQHVIWFPTDDQWVDLPEWTHGRRDQILRRVQAELQPPRYEYE